MVHASLARVARRVGAVRRGDALRLVGVPTVVSRRHIAASAVSANEASGPSALSSEMVAYARRAWRSGDRLTATGVLEHGADLIARAAEGQPAVAAAAQAAKSRTHLAWAAMQSEFGELAHAHATTAAACESAEASGSSFVGDRVAAHVAAAVAAARCHRANATRVGPDPETGRATPWDVLALEDHLEDAASAALCAEDEKDTGRSASEKQSSSSDEALETGPGLEPCATLRKERGKCLDTPAHATAVTLRIAAFGGRCAAASALNDRDAAFDAARSIFSQLEHAEWTREGGWDAIARDCADSPHGAQVASALKFAAHWTVLMGAGHASSAEETFVLARKTYDKAETLAKAVSSSKAADAATSAFLSDAVLADVALAKAQLALRAAVATLEDGGANDAGEETPEGSEDADGPEAREPLVVAEQAAADAVTAAEKLGDSHHPRLGLAIACSADVYVAKAVLAAKGKGGLGDGAGVLFAEGLYRNALRIFGTTRPPTSVASDEDAAAGGAAASHVRLVAALVHAKYAAVLRASGKNRAEEADRWAKAALKEWSDDFSGTPVDASSRFSGATLENDLEADSSSAIRAAARGIGSVGKIRAVLDGELMMPVVF